MDIKDIEDAKKVISYVKDCDKAIIVVCMYHDDSTKISTFGRPEWVGKLKNQLINLLQ